MQEVDPAYAGMNLSTIPTPTQHLRGPRDAGMIPS